MASLGSNVFVTSTANSVFASVGLTSLVSLLLLVANVGLADAMFLMLGVNRGNIGRWLVSNIVIPSLLPVSDEVLKCL